MQKAINVSATDWPNESVFLDKGGVLSDKWGVLVDKTYF